MVDSYVFAGTDNNGSSPQLIVEAAQENLTRDTYLKFPLAGISNITSAKLRVYGHTVENETPVNLSVYSVENDAWSETEINSANAPAGSFVPLGLVNVDVTERYHDLDVTEFV